MSGESLEVEIDPWIRKKTMPIKMGQPSKIDHIEPPSDVTSVCENNADVEKQCKPTNEPHVTSAIKSKDEVQVSVIIPPKDILQKLLSSCQIPDSPKPLPAIQRTDSLTTLENKKGKKHECGYIGKKGVNKGVPCTIKTKGELCGKHLKIENNKSSISINLKNQTSEVKPIVKRLKLKNWPLSKTDEDLFKKANTEPKVDNSKLRKQNVKSKTDVVKLRLSRLNPLREYKVEKFDGHHVIVSWQTISTKVKKRYQATENCQSMKNKVFIPPGMEKPDGDGTWYLKVKEKRGVPEWYKK